MFRTLVTSLFAAVLMVAQTSPAPQAAKKVRPAAKKKPAGGKQTTGLAKQQIVDPSLPFPVESIRVTGNKQFSEAEIVRMTGLNAGQLVRKPDFDAAQKRLLQSGLFETVAYRYSPVANSQSYTATFEIVEIGQIFVYRFEAMEVPESEMRAYLKKVEPMFSERIPATEPVLKRFAAALEQFTASKAKPLQIVGKLTPNNAGNLEIVFQPSSLPSVAQVNFTGNKALSTPSLQQGIAGAGIGAIYTEPRFRQVLDASIRPLYEAQGYLRVAFPKIETSPAVDVKGVKVAVQVVEGPVFKLREVVIAGELADNARLAKEGNFRPNEVVDMKAIAEGAKRIEKYLRRRGYLNAEAKIERKLDDKEKQVDITLNVDPGPQYRMGKLEIAGLDITTEPHIRKMWALQAKAPFDFEYPDIFLSEMPSLLDNMGRTRSAVKPDSGTLTVDVLLTFSPAERKPEAPKRQRPEQGGQGGPVQFPVGPTRNQ